MFISQWLQNTTDLTFLFLVNYLNDVKISLIKSQVKDTSLLVDLDRGHVSLQSNDLSHQFAVSDTDQLVHGCSGHGSGRHHW